MPQDLANPPQTVLQFLPKQPDGMFCQSTHFAIFWGKRLGRRRIVKIGCDKKAPDGEYRHKRRSADFLEHMTPHGNWGNEYDLILKCKTTQNCASNNKTLTRREHELGCDHTLRNRLNHQLCVERWHLPKMHMMPEVCIEPRFSTQAWLSADKG